MSKLIATFFGAGLAPIAPGTFGSLAAILVWFLLDRLFGWQILFAAIVALYFAGVWATARETEGSDDHDPSRIVVDEVVGQWIALLPISAGLASTGPLEVALAFLLFRVFDITKLGPIGWADRLNTPRGVMLDDVLAGIASAICLIIFGLVWT